jgi:hypothetical protein
MPLKDPEARAEYKRRWFLLNRARLTAKAKAWYAANSERHSTKCKLYYRANKEAVKVTSKIYQEKNWGAHLAACRKHNKSEKFRQTRKEWEQKNPVVALKRQLRRRMILALKEAGIRKTERTHTLIGCTPLALRLWLEAQFKPGMGWHNRSEWHIDHKKPCAAFNLTDVEQQKKCFHYSNLQPLWALENLSKGATYG